MTFKKNDRVIYAQLGLFNRDHEQLYFGLKGTVTKPVVRGDPSLCEVLFDCGSKPIIETCALEVINGTP